MDKNVIVLGIGRFGEATATKLYEKGIYVTAVDNNYKKIEKIANSVSSAIQADITEEVAMKSLGISNYDIAIIATGADLEASIQATLICKDSGVKQVIAKAISKSHARILTKIGADKIVFPELDTGERLAKMISGKNILDLNQFSSDYSLCEVKAKKEWIGKTLIELDFRNKYKVNVIALKSRQNMILDFDPNLPIEKEDSLIVIGSNENADKLTEL